MNRSRLLHERRIQLRRCPARDRFRVGREPTIRRRSRCRAPEMIRSIGEERDIRLREQRGATSIPLRKDDLVKQLDRRIFGPSRLALVDEFVEGLRFA